MIAESASRRVLHAALSMLLSLFAGAAVAAVPVHVVKTDLKAGIRAGMQSPVQFAVLVPHSASAGSTGTWSTSDGQATWTYAVQVPTAVSLSFHATQMSLPPSARLIVRGTKNTTGYGPHDLHRGQLWSRVQPGDSLQFTLTVDAAERDRVVFNIVSLQAGYRSIGPGVADHPYYRQLKVQGATASNTSCIVNYECKVTTANTPPAAATVGLIISNLYQCTGTLINDLPQDNTPYLLTARHCETGQGGGGNPGAAADVTVYWDATSSCNSSLGSLYDPGIPTQSGAETVVEQQDAWLIKLDANPVVSDAQLAGFDASGGAVQGGYTIHHAEGGDKQFTGWFGQAASVQQTDILGTNFVWNLWETVNQTGNFGPGASGSGLFDQNNNLVGSASLGRTTGDPSGYGSCPVASPPAPDGTNGAADFTSLAAVWNSTADTSSSTGSTTLKSVLDPGHTGTLVVASTPFLNLTFFAASPGQIFGQSDTLTWNAAGASQCVAGGGIGGDGWSGTLAASGSQPVTESAPSVTTYTLTCTYPGNRAARASVTITWVGPAPVVQFSSSRGSLWTTRPVTLTWSSNTSPCSIAGGSLSVSNLPASGSTTATEATPTDVTYVITCGPANDSVLQTVDVVFVTPSMAFQANSTDRLLGEPLNLAWLSAADQCTPSGGAPNDGWSASEFFGDGTFLFISIKASGTYNYTLTCSSGPLSLEQSVQVKIENDAPYANLSINPTTVTLSDSPSDYLRLGWISNMTSCAVQSQPNMPSAPPPPPPSPRLFGELQPQDSYVLAPTTPGTYVFALTCTSALSANTVAVSAPVTVTILPPPPPTATLSVTPSTVGIEQQFSVNWSSTNSLACAASGGESLGISPDWGGVVAGSANATAESVGQATLDVSCQSIDPTQGAASAQATVTVMPPAASLAASSTALVQNDQLILTWSSDYATGCTAGGGGADGSRWTGALPKSGSVTQTMTLTGTWVYNIECVAGASRADAQVTVTVSAAKTSGAGSGSSGGGGGAIGTLELALLGAWQALRRRHVARAARKYAA